MKNNIIIGGVVALILLIVGILFFIFVFKKERVETPLIAPAKTTATTTSVVTRREIPDPNVKISKYILSGKVSSVTFGEISITLERLFAGDKGNYLATDNKVVRISSSTEIVIGKLVNKRYSEVPGKISDIKNGQNLTFYSGENIRIMHIFSPYKVIINQ